MFIVINMYFRGFFLVIVSTFMGVNLLIVFMGKSFYKFWITNFIVISTANFVILGRMQNGSYFLVYV